MSTYFEHMNVCHPAPTLLDMHELVYHRRLDGSLEIIKHVVHGALKLDATPMRALDVIHRRTEGFVQHLEAQWDVSRMFCDTQVPT